jgi:hypothetical protein
MKKFLNYSLIPAIILLIAISVIAIRCKKPTDGITISVNTSGLFHYTALVQVVDNSGGVPSGLSVAVSGDDADAVYGLDGKKQLTAPAGIIVAAIHPKMEPTDSHPLHFTLRITGAKYLPLVVPITIAADQKSQTIKLPILNLTVNTPGVSAPASTTATAVNGVVATTTTLTTTPAAGSVATTSVSLPAGTQLQDANGNAITASSVTVSANNFAPSSAITLFPGGSLASTNVVGAGGTVTSAVLMPAGFTNIDMTAGGTAVKKFNAPINVTMTLDPNFKDPNTGNVIADGTVLAIYSYSTDTGQWKFEQNGTVSNVGGNLTLTFQTSHLTQFMAGAALQLLQNLAVAIVAPWYTPGTSSSVFVVAKVSNGPTYDIYSQTFDLNANLTISLDNKLPVPSATSSITLYFYDSNDHSALLGQVTVTPGSGNSVSATLSTPAQNNSITLNLQLDCRDAHQKSIVTPPDFYLLYKKTGTPATAYEVLGQVHNGTITTKQLVANSQAYDFKAVFNDHSKEVINHTVSATNSTTVGGTSFNGAVVPAQNKIDIHNLCESL